MLSILVRRSWDRMILQFRVIVPSWIVYGIMPWWDHSKIRAKFTILIPRVGFFGSIARPSFPKPTFCALQFIFSFSAPRSPSDISFEQAFTQLYTILSSTSPSNLSQVSTLSTHLPLSFSLKMAYAGAGRSDSAARAGGSGAARVSKPKGWYICEHHVKDQVYGLIPFLII